jgi:YD repeat-containing protein
MFGLDLTSTGVAEADEAPVAPVIGAYRVVRRLGEGGMGLVYFAEQSVPIRREVALKVMKPGMNSRQVLARFESERQALAMLNHPGIAAIFDAGTTEDGRPFFAMEYVPGTSINAYCDERRLPVAERLELFLQVCAAVQHAHQKGIIHRDLKPSNILVTRRDDLPFVKVIDFGVAKATAFRLTDRTLDTQLGLVLGTPEYMSPEQAGATRFDVDTRTDIYSLGVVLYELLAGIKPFERQDLRVAAVLEMLRVLREVEAPRLTTRISSLGAAAAEIAQRRQTDVRSLARQLHGDLEWITLRTLDKDPAHRYASVSELAGDVRRHLQDEPLISGPPSLTSRVLKFGKRHRALAFTAAGVVASMLAASVVSSFFWFSAERARREANRQLISALVARGMGLVDSADPLRGLVYLTHALKLEQDAARQRVHRMRIAAVGARTPRLVRLWNHGALLGPLGFATTADGVIATGGIDGVARLWSVEQNGVVRTLRHGAVIIVVDLTTDGTRLLTAGEDDVARVWHTATGEHVGEPLRHRALSTATFSPDGRFVATGSRDGTVRVWDASTGASLCEGSHKEAISRVRFAPDSQRLLTVSDNGSIGVWTLPRCAAAFQPLRHDTSYAASAAAFSPDGRLIATAAPDKTARLWDAMSGRPAMPPLRHTDNVVSTEFNKDGTLLFTTTVDRMTTVWRVLDGTTVFSRQSSSVPRAADVGAQGILATGSGGGDVDVWMPDGKRLALLPHSNSSSVSFLPSGRFLVTAARDGLLRVWDIAPSLPRPPALQMNEGDGAYQLAFSPDGKSLALTTLSAAAIRIFNVENGVPEGPPNRPVWDFDFSPDGRRLATASRQKARVWDVHTGEPVSPIVELMRILRVKFSPDGKTVAVAGGDRAGDLRVWDAASGSTRFDPVRLDNPTGSLEFTRDGRRLLTATTLRQGNLTLWNVATGKIEARASHSMGSATQFAKINQAGTEVWSVGDDQQVRVWRLSGGGSDPAPKLQVGGAPTTLQLSPNDQTVAVGTYGGEIRVADTRTFAVSAWPMRHAGLIYTLSFSRDSSVLVTTAGDGMARVWDVASGEPLTTWLTTGVQFPRYAAVSPSGSVWSYVGEGVFLERFETEQGSADSLIRHAEMKAAHTLTAATIHTPLFATDVEARWHATQTVDTVQDPGRELWLVWLARFEWLHGHVRESLKALEELRTIRPLRWPEVMQQVGALASVGQWNQVITELESHRGWYSGSPEFLFFEAIARRQLGDRRSVSTLCRQQLSEHGDTQNGERASWIVHICLMAGPDAGLDWEAVGRLAQRTQEIWRERITLELLTSAVLVRQGRLAEARRQLRDLTATGSEAPLLGRAFLALAETAAGEPVSARATLEKAAEYRPREAEAGSWYRPWFNAEAELVRSEAIAMLHGQRHPVRDVAVKRAR